MMNSGVFYTAERTDEASLHLVRRLGIEHGLSSIAGVIGSRIDIVPGSHVNLQWREGGTEKELALPRDDKPGAKYELIISNEPPEGTTTDPDELVNYYNALTETNGTIISPGERWKVGPPQHLIVTTDEIPCMPIVLNGGL